MSSTVWLIFTFTLVQMSFPVSSTFIDENCGKVKEENLFQNITTKTIRKLKKENESQNITEKIVGGEKAKILENPWMVVLSWNGEFVCGGTLINNREYSYPILGCPP